MYSVDIKLSTETTGHVFKMLCTLTLVHSFDCLIVRCFSFTFAPTVDWFFGLNQQRQVAFCFPTCSTLHFYSGSLSFQGNNLFEKGKFKEAVECYTTALSIDGENAVYYTNRAIALLKLDKYDFFSLLLLTLNFVFNKEKIS